MTTEKEIKRWLVDHYRSMKKLTNARIKKLNLVKNKFTYLKAPKNINFIYRGKKNVSASSLRKLFKAVGASDSEKYWSTSKKIAEDFSLGRNTKQLLEPGKYSVIIIGKTDSDSLLLNSNQIGMLKGVGDYYNKVWGEKLSKAISDEKEVIAIHPVKIKKILYKKITEKDLNNQKKLIKNFHK